MSLWHLSAPLTFVCFHVLLNYDLGSRGLFILAGKRGFFWKNGHFWLKNRFFSVVSKKGTLNHSSKVHENRRMSKVPIGVTETYDFKNGWISHLHNTFSYEVTSMENQGSEWNRKINIKKICEEKHKLVKGK